MTQHQAARKALELVRGLIVTLVRRRPMNFPPYAADGALEQYRIARMHLERGLAIYDKYQGAGAGQIKQGEDAIEEEAV